jgi:hypothetical protein
MSERNFLFLIDQKKMIQQLFQIVVGRQISSLLKRCPKHVLKVLLKQYQCLRLHFSFNLYLTFLSSFHVIHKKSFYRIENESQETKNLDLF